MTKNRVRDRESQNGEDSKAERPEFCTETNQKTQKCIHTEKHIRNS